uniref:Reverse transcriptase domain-containing protein n=1 Tax=Aegilops tauschii subsp. strangulata TaxID=200361 RepID=A0A453NIM5_AEGTS
IIQICSVTMGEEQQQPVPEPIQQLLSEFSEVFGEPQGLPPRRACDHCIPLIPGAQPVNIRPYRHKPDHKDEIEKQVEELLKVGIIQPSTC